MKEDNHSISVQNYKDFIDGLVEIRPGVLSRWVLTTGYVEEKEIRGRIRRSSDASYNIIFTLRTLAQP
ncbi:hypothetical protein C0Q44_26290 [Paenibacillus sp. PCH8]|uniref:DUF6547 family protein n=1 Tax=Paenibacillus sp. PCH8 TaxID=2066524 RepID=UPI000CFA7DD3|nr:DUF6547 family protein [Paenibacillus sp. PCH8]PQP80739.1 hypothetical protein C0Q44_26290 [Paenibacillus sp. PCH8]